MIIKNISIKKILVFCGESAAGFQQAAATFQETCSSMNEMTYCGIELGKLADHLNNDKYI